MKKFLLLSSALFVMQFSRAQWEPDVRLTNTNDSSSTNSSRGHNITTNGDTVHIVWYDKSDGNWEIYYMRSTDKGVSWESAIRLTNDPARSYSPSIALSGQDVHVAWFDMKPGNFEIYYVRSTDGGTNWDDEQRLTDDSYFSSSATISSYGSYVHLAWVNSDNISGIYQVFYKNSSDGGISWGDEICLSGDSPIAYSASMAVSGSDVYVVWHDGRDGDSEIYYRKSVDNGFTWEPEIRLTYLNMQETYHDIAVSGSTVHLVWADWRHSNSEIYYRGSTDGGENWGEDTRISLDQATSTLPKLAISNSMLHVVWQDNRSGYYDIYYNYSLDGGKTWLQETQLNDYFYRAERPFIAVSDSVLHVIWRDLRDENYEIYYKRNPTGGMPVGTEDVPSLASGGQLSVYPNPASRQLTVERSAVGGQRSAVRLSILDLCGREIKEFENISSFPYPADISDLFDGVYILRIMDDSCNSGSMKFMKVSE